MYIGSVDVACTSAVAVIFPGLVAACYLRHPKNVSSKATVTRLWSTHASYPLACCSFRPDVTSCVRVCFALRCLPESFSAKYQANNPCYTIGELQANYAIATRTYLVL